MNLIAKAVVMNSCLPYEQFQTKVADAEASAPAQAIEAADQISSSGRSVDAISSTSKFAQGRAAALALFGKNAVGDNAERRKFEAGAQAARLILGKTATTHEAN
jgi:hypothetical protein